MWAAAEPLLPVAVMIIHWAVTILGSDRVALMGS